MKKIAILIISLIPIIACGYSALIEVFSAEKDQNILFVAIPMIITTYCLGKHYTDIVDYVTNIVNNVDDDE